jgi:CHAT domain-containing protein
MNYHRYYIIWGIIWFPIISLWGQTAPSCPLPDNAAAHDWATKGKDLFKQGSAEQAIFYFEKAIKVYRTNGCDSNTTLIERNLLKCYFLLDQKDKFLKTYRQAQLTIDTQSTSGRVRVGRLYYLYSRYLLEQDKLDSAHIYGNRAMQLLKTATVWKYTIKVPLHLALVSYYEQDYETMEKHIDAAYDINTKYLDNDKKQLNKITELYAGLYYKNGDYRRALEKTKRSLDQSLATMNTPQDTVRVANLYNNIGLYYIELGDIYNAIDYCKNALQLSKKMGEYDAVATIYLNMGELYDRQQELEKALFYYEQALLALPKIVGIAIHEVRRINIAINNNIASVSIKLNRYKVALDALEKNLVLHKEESSRLDETYVVLGKYYEAKSAYSKAQAYYKKGLEIKNDIYGEKHPRVADIYYSLSTTVRKEGKVKEAMDYLTKAEIALQIPGDTLTNGTIQVSNKNTLLKVLSTRAKLYKEQKKTLLAFETTQKAVKVLDEVRMEFKEEASKIFILQTMIPTYELSLTLALELYQKNKQRDYLAYAFQLIEKSKAVLLLDALQVEKARDFGDVDPVLLEEEHRIDRQLTKKRKLLFDAKALRETEKANQLQEEILLLKRAADKLQAQLREEYPRYHELRYENNIASLEMVQQYLDKETTLIEYFVGNQNLYIFSVQKDSAWLSTVPIDLNFENAIRALRSALTNISLTIKDERSAYLLLTNNARNIYQKYVAPAIGQELPKQLIVVPDGLLNYVPFEVLLTEKPNYKETSFTNLPYLIKTTTTNYHYSSSLMLFNKQSAESSSKTGELLGFASSYQKDLFDSSQSIKGLSRKHHDLRAGLDELPGALAEVAYLEKTFKGRFYSREKASEQFFKTKTEQQHYSIIHLAMHGIVDPKEPSFSSLAFTYMNDSIEDDFLHAYELSSLHLNTDLVVLSACETGFGKYTRGEGVLSMGRSFMYAGAPSLVMTLWSINDKATSILIKQFYQYLEEGYPKDEALRLAKLDYMESSKGIATHPFFWASLISVGDTNPLTLQGKGSNYGWIIGGLCLVLIGGLMWRKGSQQKEVE